jgi:hypothetical protein
MAFRCWGEARASACTTSHEHLLSSMSVPTFPITSGSPKQSSRSSWICVGGCESEGVWVGGCMCVGEGVDECSEVSGQ